jgi:hypothetical protein
MLDKTRNSVLTDSMEQISFSKHEGSQIPRLLWNPKIPSEEPAIGPYPEPDESTPYHPSLLL